MNARRLFSLALVLILLATLTAVAGGAPLSGPCAPGAAYDPACDANQDGVITVNDIQLTAGHWNQSGPWTSDNNHTHLGQTWTGNNNPLKLEGSYGAPDHAPLVLSNAGGSGLRITSASVGVSVGSVSSSGVFVDSTGYNGVWVNSAGGYGVWVNSATLGGMHVGSTANTGIYVGSTGSTGVAVGSAGSTGVAVGSAGSDGVSVGSSGSPTTQVPSAQKNGFEVAGAQGNGLYVGRADNDGVQVNAAGGYGVKVDSAGGDGVYVGTTGYDGVLVRSAGIPTSQLLSSEKNGFEVAGAQGNGLYVGQADNTGVYVDSAAWDGVYVDSAAYDGVAVTSAPFGVAVYTASNVGVYANTTQASGEWGFYTPDRIFGTIGMFSAVSLVAQVSGPDGLTAGDLVAVAGLADPLPGSAAQMPLVRLADGTFTGVIGVVESRLALTSRPSQPPVEADETPAETEAPVLRNVAGPAQAGDYVGITVLGAAQVKVDSAAVIETGQRLTVSSQPGHARALRTLKVLLADGSGTADMLETAPVVGIAMTPAANGLVWVLVNPQ